MAGKFEEVGNFVARGANNVDPRLVDILNKAAEATGMTVQAYSGFRPGDKRQHGSGHATDIRIIGPDGKEVPNYQSPEAFSAYEALAQAARAIQMRDHPELEKQFRWGGYFSGDKGKYGAMDLMHFDLGGSDKLGMAGGSWDGGLTKDQAAIWGMKPGLQGGDTSALAFAPAQKGNGASAALDAMAGGTLKANPVHTVDYVPPPGSNATPQFTPLVTIPHLQPRETDQQQNATPAPPVAQPAASVPSSDDLMRAWGIQDTGEAPPPAAATPSPDEQLIKAWGLDQNEQAPAAGMAAGQKREHTPFEKLITGEPQTPQAPSVAGDVAASGASGLARGTAETAMLPVTTTRAAGGLSDWLSYKLVDFLTQHNDLVGAPVPTEEQRESLKKAMTEQNGPLDRAQDAVRGFMDENLYAPKTEWGKVAHSAGEFIPGAVAFGGGNLLTNAVKYGVVPGVASEMAGQATEGTKFEPYARIGGALLAPVAAEGLLRGAEAAGNKLLTMTPRGAAANNLTAALAESGKTVDDISLEMARNPRLNPMDVDTNLQQIGMNLATQGGAPRSVLNSAVESRVAGAKGAVTDAYDAAAGTVPDVKAYLDGLKATTRANAKQAFGDALTGAQPVDITPVLESIDNVIAPGVNGVVGKVSDLPQGPVEQALARVRAKLANSNEMLTDADRLHTIQSNLRTEADTLAKSASGQDKLVAGALRDVRQKIVDQIDNATGGKYRPAQKQYADDNAIQDAFDKGLEVFKGGTGKGSIENRPEYWEAWVKDATPAELDAAKVGTRVAVDQTISSVRNAAAKGEAIADVDFNVARLESLLGKSETQKLVQTLKDEQRIAQTNAKLFAGSQTAPRQAANKLTEVKQVTPSLSLSAPFVIGGGYQVGGIPGAIAGAGLSLGKMGVQAAQRARDIARNRLMAEALSGDVTRFREAVAPAGTANRLLAPIRGAQAPLLRSSGAVPLSIGMQAPNELLRPPRK
ncbi:hypothetical protein [Rhizobium sp. BK456]|uniref:hypothetical protein n=1 Tax=Rhizobium sp. BK456 TaxID=2587007 RepID=UPI001614A0F3|nr:hypothetical protein [Rhizobium sp. BK456]MBB3521040.1 hypothetical protein [Rhizobium sp. BK456]